MYLDYKHQNFGNRLYTRIIYTEQCENVTSVYNSHVLIPFLVLCEAITVSLSCTWRGNYCVIVLYLERQLLCHCLVLGEAITVSLTSDRIAKCAYVYTEHNMLKTT